MNSETIEANIFVHTKMADTYDTAEPHFRPENRAKVRSILEQLRQRCPGGVMLDIGCGTGFLLSLAVEFFDQLHGIDVTQAMLDKVDLSSGKITLHNGPAEELPFPDEHFDFVSAYSFIHHTKDYGVVLREAARVLKPGGLCYVDLEPNKLFWDAVKKLPADDAGLSEEVRKARDSVTAVDAQVERDYGVPQEVFRQAEYSKAILGGIDPYEIKAQCSQYGFSQCEVDLHWYLGQAKIMHGQSFEQADKVDEFLSELAPLTDHLYKYLRIVFKK